ncbi:type II secretion system F family protein [Salinibacterium soli]|uniref:Type II secretion system F family protein n=1 Tax=Antiquaquibacter soli TaxID=3064523 RepID=A0ABT9BP20_9MICO|nr:type II secretion system F family protein [Protaetiibacter sp. WY-16]MDO7881037.1 type II secretion system F family protein [Protaetiibacter sp. WY-16]
MRSAPALADVARVAQRLAVLLDAGVAPSAAWQFVADSDSRSAAPSISEHVARAAEPAGIADAIGAAALGRPAAESRAWRGLAAAWQVATTAGAPLASALREYARSLRELADAERDVEVALASPRATARVVLALPAIGVLFGALMGFGTLEVLFATPLGWACLAIGGALMFAARAWNWRLMKSARPVDSTPGLSCELLAIAMGGGASLDRARASADAATVRFGLVAADGGRADAAIRLATRAGVPVAELLRAEAEELRRDARSEAQRGAAALSVRLMLPLGLCVLPAFLVLGVAPLVAAVVTSVLDGLT